MLDFLKMLLTPEFFFSIIRISAPILFATLAAIVVEKAGFCNIGLEGLMMFSALTGSLVSYYAHSWVWGLLAALAIGVLMSLMMGFFAFQLKTDITLVGIAVNMMGSGGTLFLCKVITNLSEGTSMASSTGLITSNLLIPNINIPLIDKIPFLGSIISGHNLLTWIAFICCALTSVMLYKTSLGLNIRAVGENPNAASSVGVSVLKIKYIAIGFSGLMCGFAARSCRCTTRPDGPLTWSQDAALSRWLHRPWAAVNASAVCCPRSCSALRRRWASNSPPSASTRTSPPPSPTPLPSSAL